MQADKMDERKQREFRDYYDESSYFEDFEDHYGTKDSKFNLYARKYIFSIYYPKPGERVLDLGCGWGNISLTLQRHGFEVTGVDYSIKSVSICKTSAESMGLDPDCYVCGDVSALPFPDDRFDVVYTAGVVEHLFPDVYKRFVEESHRVLCRGGKLVIGTPNPGHVLELMKRNNIIVKEDVSHVDYKTMPSLQQSLSAAGFDIEAAFYYPSHLPILSQIERLTMRFLPLMRRRLCIRARKT
jgi:2-polyprenyl-3-methyl-5-hydroxy-6-metoxy-1,4-benzoquinol methylase